MNNRRVCMRPAAAAIGPVAGMGSAEPQAAPTGFLPRIPLPVIVGSIQRLARDLGVAISRAATRTGVPPWLITVIAAKEIQFFPYTRTNPAVKATGPAQMTPLTLFDVYYIASQWGLVTPELNAYLAQKMGGYWGRFRQLALNRQADVARGVALLKDSELNLTMAGLHLACLIKLFTGGGGVDQSRVVLGYNRGIAWSLVGLAKQMGVKQTSLIDQVARPTWAFPAQYYASPQTLMASVSGQEAKAYIADHLAPGGYFNQVVRLGLAPTTTI